MSLHAERSDASPAILMAEDDSDDRFLMVRAFRELPIAVWTTSRHEEDMAFCRANGARSYVTKQHSYTELVKIIEKVLREWMPLPD